MAITRRSLGLGLLALAAAGTGGYVSVKDRPELRGMLGNSTRLSGFVGGEKQAFLEDPDVVRALAGYGLQLDARVAGSVEMVREKALLSQNPQFLWPSSSIMVDLARKNGVKIRNDQVVINSPVVIYTWEPVADGLMKHGLVTKSASGHYQLDLAAMLQQFLANADWKSLGVDQLYGHARMISTDPNRSNSGFMFAGLVLSLLAGDVAKADDLATFGPHAQAIFRNMGFKSSSSGKLFEQYIAGGIGGEPMIVGYENQLVEWILADPARWGRVMNGGGAKPVILYPRPTVYSAHPVIVTDDTAASMIDVLLSPKLQELAWTKHGFRGPLGSVTGTMDTDIARMLPPQIEAVLPMPDADVMLPLLDMLKG
jgi:hypothetical protein